MPRSRIFQLVSDGDEVTAILVRKLAPPASPGAAGREERHPLPPVVISLAGRVVEGDDLLLGLAWGGLQGEIPLLFNKDTGDLADIDQRLAALRDRFGARPWPPLLDPWPVRPRPPTVTGPNRQRGARPAVPPILGPERVPRGAVPGRKRWAWQHRDAGLPRGRNDQARQAQAMPGPALPRAGVIVSASGWTGCTATASAAARRAGGA